MVNIFSTNKIPSPTHVHAERYAGTRENFGHRKEGKIGIHMMGSQTRRLPATEGEMFRFQRRCPFEPEGEGAAGGY